MKKPLFPCLAVLLCACASAQSFDWGMGLEGVFAPLSTDKGSFADGGGADLFATCRWNDRVTQRFGFNFIRFEGNDRAYWNGRKASADDLTVRAIYTGFDLHSRPFGGLGLYARLDLGVSSLSSVRHEVSVSAERLGMERAYDGGDGAYLGFGLGIAYRLDDRWVATAGWDLRDYGKLKGNPAPSPRLATTRDIQMRTGSFHFGLQHLF